MSETVIPVCAPHTFAAPVTDPSVILKHPLLHLETRPRGWKRWLSTHNIDENLPTGMVFDQFSTMAQAAVHGMGIALLPTFVAEPYLKSGQLMKASSHASKSIGTYYLVWSNERAESPPLIAFCSWLKDQVS